MGLRVSLENWLFLELYDLAIDSVELFKYSFNF